MAGGRPKSKNLRGRTGGGIASIVGCGGSQLTISAVSREGGAAGCGVELTGAARKGGGYAISAFSPTVEPVDTLDAHDPHTIGPKVPEALGFDLSSNVENNIFVLYTRRRGTRLIPAHLCVGITLGQNLKRQP